MTLKKLYNECNEQKLSTADVARLIQIINAFPEIDSLNDFLENHIVYFPFFNIDILILCNKIIVKSKIFRRRKIIIFHITVIFLISN